MDQMAKLMNGPVGQKARFPYFWFSGFRYFRVSGLQERQKSVFLGRVTRPQGDGRALRGCRLASSQDGPADDGAADSENKTLNFKVSLEFKKEFKGFAGSQGITMTDLLKEGFALSKKKRQK